VPDKGDCLKLQVHKHLQELIIAIAVQLKLGTSTAFLSIAGAHSMVTICLADLHTSFVAKQHVDGLHALFNTTALQNSNTTSCYTTSDAVATASRCGLFLLPALHILCLTCLA